MSLEESNNIALDMVLLAVGALGAFYIKGGAVETTIDAGVGDAFLASILLYLQSDRQRLVSVTSGKPSETTAAQGIIQLSLGLSAILWTLYAF